MSSRMVVVRNKEGGVSCLPMSKSKSYYEENYDVVVFVNKNWNYYYVSRIKSYFSKKF